MMRAGTKSCFDSEEPVPAARHYIRLPEPDQSEEVVSRLRERGECG